ncbi:peptidase A22B, signal peptide peptidase, partial [Mucidula mucida]
MGTLDWDLFSSYAGLLTLASASIYAGSFGSLPNPKRKPGEKPLDDEDDEDEPERVSSEDAWLFPLIGSATLLGLYLVIKYVGKEWINWILGWYFSFAGLGSIWKSSIALVSFTVGTERWKKFEKYTFKIHRHSDSTVLLSLSGRSPSLYLFPFSLLFFVLYTFTSTDRKSVLLSDILSMSFSHNALSLLRIDSFKTGTILLSGLFFYDIWWVFGTKVMVEVATSLDAPIKLLWPKSLSFADTRGYTMLGLGDIVIPGMFIALALRYDYHRFSEKSPATANAKFRKPYFYASLAAYISGLVITVSVMHSFGKAQPALLYLSPACILSFLTTALVRGELSDAWAWSDGP